MPIVTTIERRSQLPRRCHIGIAVQRMADLTGILFVDTRECKVCEPLRSLDVELSYVLRGRIHREEQGQSKSDEFHRLIL